MSSFITLLDTIRVLLTTNEPKNLNIPIKLNNAFDSKVSQIYITLFQEGLKYNEPQKLDQKNKIFRSFCVLEIIIKGWIMAFKVEYLKSREELSKLGVDSYETELTKRSILMGKKRKNLWDEFGDNHFIHIDKENDIWIIYLGNKYRDVRYMEEVKEDIFLFNYKGSIIELLLKVEEGTPERMFNETFGVTYEEIIEMNSKELHSIDKDSLIEVICNALETRKIGEKFLAEFGKKYANELVSKKIKCKFRKRVK